MKKSRPPFWQRYAKIMFWGFVILGTLWLVFAPRPKPLHHQAQNIEVSQIPAPPKPPVPKGDELAEQPAETPPEIAPLAAPPQPEKLLQANGKPRIAIVIDDVGLDLAGSRRAVRLPAYITLSYIPYSTNLQEQANEARKVGHELLLHMPMQPMGNADPGPGALLLGLSHEELQQRLNKALNSFSGFDGMNNHMGSKFTADNDGMNLVIDELQQRHLFFLDSRTTAQSVGAKLAQAHGVPNVSRDVFLDDDINLKSVQTQLEQTERAAKRKGFAIAIGHPHAITLQALEAWIPEAEQRGFVFVPLKSLVNHSP